MNEHDAFLRAIIAAPEDDTPRLVCADWLEEHGDEARAEFIRVECELARLRYGAPNSDARAWELQQRQGDLETRHKKTWLAQLNLPKNRHTYLWFRRGMVASVWCTVRYFVQHADALLDAAPLETVCLRKITPRNLTEVISHPAFPRVRGVEFLMDETPSEVVGQLFEALRGSHLRTVKLTVHMVNTPWSGWHTRHVALATVIAGCPALAGLKRLLLSHGGVGDEGGLALARSPHLGGLEFLDLKENALSPAVQKALRKRFGRRLCLGRDDFSNFTLGELGWA